MTSWSKDLVHLEQFWAHEAPHEPHEPHEAHEAREAHEAHIYSILGGVCGGTVNDSESCPKCTKSFDQEAIWSKYRNSD